MSKQNFYTLLNRYRNGESNEKENQLVEQWFALLDADSTYILKKDYSELEKKLWNAINEKRQIKKSSRNIFLNWRWAMVAATVIITVTSVYFINYSSPKGKLPLKSDNLKILTLNCFTL